MTFVKHNPLTFNNLVNELFNNIPANYNEISGYGVQPPTNIHETNDGFHVELLAAGRSKEAFKISVENNILTIAYDQQKVDDAENYKTLRREFKAKNFKRSFSLDNKVNPSDIKAKYENGILNVFLPKKEEVKVQPQEINVL